VQLKIGGQVQEAVVAETATSSTFTAHLPAGAADLEAILLDRQGKPLAGACYITIRRGGN
jgi:hypothetical protein